MTGDRLTNSRQPVYIRAKKYALTSEFVEGFHNKVKVLKQRCYGVTNRKHFFQRLYLDLEGYRLFNL
jgi:transposase